MDVKETKEMLIAINLLAIAIIPALKDGIALSDVGIIVKKLQEEPEIFAKIKDAFIDAQMIAAEVKEIDLGEALELGKIQLEYIPKIVEALKA